MSVININLPKAFLGFSVGRPAALYDYTNPDWITSLKLGYETGSEVAADLNRYDRKRARETRKETDHPSGNTVKQPRLHSPNNTCSCSIQTDMHMPSILQTNLVNVDCEVQTDVSMKQFSGIQKELSELQQEVFHERQEINQFRMSPETLENDNEKVKYFTGLPSYAVLSTLFQYLESFIPTSGTALTIFQQCMLSPCKAETEHSSH